MGYELNTKAYQLIIQIEVGLRELLIKIIEKKGVNQWFSDFLGNVQRDSLKEITERIKNANESNLLPDVRDQYVFKMNKASKEFKYSFTSNLEFRHPFYYLNWTDILSLMRMKSNIREIDELIGNSNREAIVDNLKNITLLRNAVAHSRYITQEEFRIVEGAFIQVKGLIPGFDNLIQEQTFESAPKILKSKVSSFIDQIQTDNMLEKNLLDEFMLTIEKCINSFWLITFEKDFINQIITLKSIMQEYIEQREIPGGLLKIVKWRGNNAKFLSTIKSYLNE